MKYSDMPVVVDVAKIVKEAAEFKSVDDITSVRIRSTGSNGAVNYVTIKPDNSLFFDILTVITQASVLEETKAILNLTGLGVTDIPKTELEPSIDDLSKKV